MLICLNTVKWFQVLRNNINNLIFPSHMFAHILKGQTVLFDPGIGANQVLPLWVREDLRAMELKGNFTFPKTPELEPHHQIV